MDLRLFSILGFLSLALVVTSATLPSEDYWQSMLPNTQMPKSIRDLLPSASDLTEEKSTAVGVGKGGVNVNTGKGKSGAPTSVNVGRKGVGVSTGKPDGGTNVGVGKGGVSVNTGPKKKPVVVSVDPKSPFVYRYAASEDQLQDNPNVALFFQEKDLQSGTTMNLHFTKTTPGAAFLPSKEADATPFSSTKFSDVLQRFAVVPGSKEAQVMKNTIQECEEPGVQGEDKYCATSLESMVDFSTSKLGTNVQAMSTEMDREETKKQQYTITGVQKKASDKAVVCHAQPYVYAVFYCHATLSTKAYKVSLVGADGTKANAIAVCHTDTSKWNPKHLAFQVLKIKPGTTPVCHFLPEDHVVWVKS
ncbi:BURP domain protein RD22-like isoform X2 [Telopea speciosissima]|uniref:BURP domain protein RD22-like isoform X2 n=1 Tax=Telopea speciosissima TaxID=54955 RepID=UPI001CC5AA9E|nr:BURP domain protein RD22-like isoform X2 [Telopea speciosissima]